MFNILFILNKLDFISIEFNFKLNFQLNFGFKIRILSPNNLGLQSGTHKEFQSDSFGFKATSERYHMDRSSIASTAIS